MITKKLKRIFLIYIFALSLFVPPEIFGQNREKRVVFPKGKTTVSYKGKLPKQYADYDAYVLKARKGQTLTVKLTTDSPDASFAIYEMKIYGPDEDQIFSGKELDRTFSGKMPITSEYSLQIYGVTSSEGTSTGASYTIEISLK